MKLNNKIYDALKWICLVAIPAFTTAYVGLSAVWGWPYADEVAKTSAVVCVLIGSLLGVSTINYNKEQAGKQPPDVEGDKSDGVQA